MPKPHVPVLDLIPNLDNEVRFYATIGIIVSLWGAFERTLFQFFEKASGMPHEMAASIYYHVNSDEARSQMTNQTMRHLLKGKSELTQWEDLYKRLANSGETTRYRNLVAHNPVLLHITMPAEPADFRINPASTDLPIGKSVGMMAPSPELRPIVRHSVSQDPVQVTAGRRQHFEADITKLRENCAELERLHTDLDAFFAIF